MKKLFIFLILILSNSIIFAQNFEGIITYHFSSGSRDDNNFTKEMTNVSKDDNGMSTWRYYFKYPYIIEEMSNKEGKKIVKSFYNQKTQQTIGFCDGKVCWDKKVELLKNNVLPENIKKLNDTIVQNTNVTIFSVKNKTREEVQTFWIDKTKHQNIQFPVAQIANADKEDFTMFNEYLKGLPLRIEMPLPLTKDIKAMLEAYSSNKKAKINTFLVFELKNIEEKKLDKKFFEQAKKAFSK